MTNMSVSSPSLMIVHFYVETCTDIRLVYLLWSFRVISDTDSLKYLPNNAAKYREPPHLVYYKIAQTIIFNCHLFSDVIHSIETEMFECSSISIISALYRLCCCHISTRRSSISVVRWSRTVKSSQVSLFIEHNINSTFVDPRCFTDGQKRKKKLLLLVFFAIAISKSSVTSVSL